MLKLLKLTSEYNEGSKNNCFHPDCSKNLIPIALKDNYFEYYETRNWQTSNGTEIRDWRALATNWMDRAELFEEENKPNKKQASQIKDNLRTVKNKDYGQPL